MSLKSDLLLLNIDKSGIANVVEINSEQIDENNILFLIDEKNNKNWLYIGEKVSFIHKRGAMRVANSLKKFGYEIEGSIFGRKCSDLVIIDKTGDDNDDNEEKLFYSLIQKGNSITLNKEEIKTKEKIDNAFLEKEMIIKPISETFDKFERSEENILIQPRETIETEKKDINSEEFKKFGILISSILTEFPEIRIFKSKGGERKFTVESPEGSVCFLEIEKDKLIISSESSFGDSDRKVKIQQKFIDLSKKFT